MVGNGGFMKKFNFFCIFGLILSINAVAGDVAAPGPKTLLKQALSIAVKNFSLQELKDRLTPDLFESALVLYKSSIIQKIGRVVDVGGLRVLLPFIVNDRYIIRWDILHGGPFLERYYFDIYIYDRKADRQFKKVIRFQPGVDNIIAFNFVDIDNLYIFLRRGVNKFIHVISLTTPGDLIDLDSSNGAMVSGNVESIKVLRSKPDLLVELQRKEPDGNVVSKIDMSSERKIDVIPLGKGCTLPSYQFFYLGSNYFIVVPKVIGYRTIAFKEYTAFMSEGALRCPTVKDIVRGIMQTHLPIEIIDGIDFYDYQAFIIAVEYDPARAEEYGTTSPVELVFSDSDKTIHVDVAGSRAGGSPVYDYDQQIGLVIAHDKFDWQHNTMRHYLTLIDKHKESYQIVLSTKPKKIRVFHYDDYGLIVCFDGDAVTFYRYKDGQFTEFYRRALIPVHIKIEKVDQQLVIADQASIEIAHPLAFVAAELDPLDKRDQRRLVKYDKYIRPNLYYQQAVERGKRVRIQ